jgi:hypothetical protein
LEEVAAEEFRRGKLGEVSGEKFGERSIGFRDGPFAAHSSIGDIAGARF